MQNAVFKIIDLVGSSDKSIEDAIQGAIEHATKTIRGLAWFEVVEARIH
jgi:flavin-binding protein dodecin